MSRLFGKVSYVGIDTDPEYFYPKGAARVTFQNSSSMIMAVKKRFLMPMETKTRKMACVFFINYYFIFDFCKYIILNYSLNYRKII